MTLRHWLALLAAVVHLLTHRRPAPPRPGFFTLFATGLKGASSMRVRASLPAKTAPDVVSFELSYTLDGGAATILTSAGDPIEFDAPVGSTVTASFVEIDSSGNRSEPSDPETLVLKDVTAPPRPGSFGLEVID